MMCPRRCAAGRAEAAAERRIVHITLENEPGAVVTAADALPGEAVTEIEDGLRTLKATGAGEQVHRLVVKSLPVASVLTVGLGKQADDFPTDLIRRAAEDGYLQ